MLLTIVLIMLIWWSIHFGLYYTFKMIIRRSSDRQLIEMMTAPFIAFYNHRRWKRTESYGFFGALVALPVLIFFARRFFSSLQDMLIFGEGLYISRSSFVMPIVFLSVGLFYMFYLIGAKSSITTDKNWKRQPTIFQLEERIARYKVRFLWNSVLCQMLFILGLFHYVHLNEEGVQHNSFYDLTETTIFYQDINDIDIWVDEWDVIRDGQREKEYHPYFTILLKNGDKIELWDNVHFSEKDYDLLKKTVYQFHQNLVLIDFYEPDLYDKSKMKKVLREGIYNKVIDFFEYARMVVENRADPIAVGEAFELDEVAYRVDSCVKHYGSEDDFFSQPLKGNRFDRVYMTIQNNSSDTEIIVRLDMRVLDELDNEYRSSIWGRDSFETYIPPQTTHSGFFAFQVPDSVYITQMSYHDGFINKRYMYFQLRENRPTPLLVPSIEDSSGLD